MTKKSSQSKSVEVVKKHSMMLCPHCGHDDFRKKREGFFLFGQQFECTKCKGVFKKANVVRVKQTEVKVKKGSSSFKSGGGKYKKKGR